MRDPCLGRLDRVEPLASPTHQPVHGRLRRPGGCSVPTQSSPARLTRFVRKTRWLPLGGALVTLSLLLASAVSASPDEGASLRVLSHSTSFKAMQANPPAVSPGDELFIGGSVMRPASPQTKIGTFGVHCAATGADGQILCNAVYALPRGEITAEVLVAAQPPQTFSVAITGGTGVYSNARGWATIVTLNATDDQVTFHLIGVTD